MPRLLRKSPPIINTFRTPDPTPKFKSPTNLPISSAISIQAGSWKMRRWMLALLTGQDMYLCACRVFQLLKMNFRFWEFPARKFIFRPICFQSKQIAYLRRINKKWYWKLPSKNKQSACTKSSAVFQSKKKSWSRTIQRETSFWVCISTTLGSSG